ncbi:hypothetical protein BC628DRAFT_1189015 [Trametes gibbosa]|nr:hypothetical protein BC628DRAFT_1189015 [Trametes gibbosa]
MRLSTPGLRVAISLHSLIVLSLAIRTVRSLLVNRTIDDQLGDSVTGVQPVYAPEGGWALGSGCTTCNIHPGLVDLAQAFDSTWHDTTHHPGGPEQVIMVEFSGSAVYVFSLIANVVSSTTTLTNLTARAQLRTSTRPSRPPNSLWRTSIHQHESSQRATYHGDPSNSTE